MHPNFPNGQWLLLTLTLGVGGSLLAIGSAPALHVLGLMKGRLEEGEGYTFTLHLRWMPAILLGFCQYWYAVFNQWQSVLSSYAQVPVLLNENGMNLWKLI